ncbi:alpha-1-antitrypsin-like [Pelodytes ibericus]
MRVLLCLSLLMTTVLARPSKSHECPHHETHTKKLSESDIQVAKSNLCFGAKLYKQVSANKHSTDNLFISPLSISTAFAALALGAKSSTHRQIYQTLCLNSTQTEKEVNEAFQLIMQILNKPKSNLQVNIGNALFLNKEYRVLKDFTQQARRYYDAQVIKVNFKNSEETKTKINDYVRHQTNGKINEMVKSVDQSSVMVSVNVVTFLGEWLRPFNPNLTRREWFHISKVEQIQVPMMTQTGRFKTYYDVKHQCDLLRMPYKNNAFMLIIMPKLGKMQSLEDALTDDLILTWLQKGCEQQIQLKVPKFSFTNEIKLNGVLTSMGMTDVFQGSTDFTGIMKSPNLQVSDATHSAAVNINEFGTEAHAGTTIEVGPTSVPPSIEVNRPFMVVIGSRDTRSVLFIGRVANPLKN